MDTNILETEVWTIKQHHVRHGDVLDDLTYFLPKGGLDFIYMDPPWGDGNYKYWQTQNRKMNGIQEDKFIPQDRFLYGLFFLMRSISNSFTVIFLEYGLRWQSVIHYYAKRLGILISAISTPVYGSKKTPNNLYTMAFTSLKLPADYTTRINGTTGIHTLREATAPFDLEGKTIFDGTCGTGLTAKLAVENSMIFYGNDINLARLRQTMKILQE